MGSTDSIRYIIRIQEKKTTGGCYLYINIPRKIQEQLGLAKGDFLELRLKGNKIILKKL